MDFERFKSRSSDDLFNWIEYTWKSVVYIARYGRGQSIDMVSAWPITKVFRIMSDLADLIQEEAKRGGSFEDIG